MKTILKTKKSKISKIRYEDRVLLMSHCLRPSRKCPAKIDENGLNCINCINNCAIGQLKKEAITLGYMGVCIAPGGSLAIKYVREKNPSGIVAVACLKELAEGIYAVKKHNRENKRNLTGNDSETKPPVIQAIPLTKEGCVDTAVDIDTAIGIIRS
jgi:hypothetical protein